MSKPRHFVLEIRDSDGTLISSRDLPAHENGRRAYERHAERMAVELVRDARAWVVAGDE